MPLNMMRFARSPPTSPPCPPPPPPPIGGDLPCSRPCEVVVVEEPELPRLHPRRYGTGPRLRGYYMYQRVSPDCHPPSNGRKLCMRAFRDDDEDSQPSKGPRLDGCGKPLRPRQPSSAAQDRAFLPPCAAEPPTHLENHPPNRVVVVVGGGDVLPQWGQNKRSRGPRSERSGSGDDHSSGGRQGKVPRRRISTVTVKQSTATMNPPAQIYSRARALASLMERENCGGVSHGWTIEERPTTTTTSISGAFTRQEKRSSPPSPPDKMRKATQTTTTSSAANGSSSAHVDSRNPPSTTHSSEQDAAPAAPMATEKLNLDLFEWPRIYISLSRKEKEDDFLAMKGTKLPQRPKKRAKNIDKNLQYCFPGMWLSDLTKGRYEVREKKCVRKKRRGLKGMESMDSDSD